MSTVSESNPWWAMISAEKALGMDSQPLTTASPRAQIAFSVFSRIGSPSSGQSRILEMMNGQPVTPAQAGVQSLPRT